MSSQKLPLCCSVKPGLLYAFGYMPLYYAHILLFLFVDCSNSLSGTTPSSIGCILPCNGDRTEFCGNEFYFNGYQNNAFGQFSSATSPITVPGYGYWVSLGCYGYGFVVAVRCKQPHSPPYYLQWRRSDRGCYGLYRWRYDGRKMCDFMRRWADYCGSEER
jgi:hypothetical protein